MLNESETQDLVKKYDSLLDHGENFNKILDRVGDVFATTSTHAPCVEIGTNMGGSALCFLELMQHYGKKENWLYTIDPYGAIPYHNGETLIKDSIYGNQRYRNSMAKLSTFAEQCQLNWYHFKCTSNDFMKHVYNTYTECQDSKEVKFDKFLFVYIDGNHEINQVKSEMTFFLDRLELGGLIIVDDTESRTVDLTQHVTRRDDGMDYKVDSDIRQRLCIHKKKV